MAIQDTKINALKEIVLTRFQRDQLILAADAPNRVVSIARNTIQLVAVREAHSVVGGAACTITVEKLTSTTAPGSGTALLTAAIDLTATINTVVAPALTATLADLQFAAGDRVGLKFTGTQTGLVGTISLEFRRID